MVVLTPLTLWLAVTNAVPDCGCFGEALHMSNWATFGKNVLLVLALVYLLCYNKDLPSVYGPAVQWMVALWTFAFIIAVAVIGYSTQPLIDYRPYAIGTCETIHSCNRGENIAIIFINNAIYGMTGGQMAPTTLLGQKTATCPYGRRVDLNGYPLSITPLLAQLDGTCYVTRQAVHTPAAVRKAKRAIEQAFRNSMEKRGTSVVEIVSTCNSGWKLTPEKANQWMAEHMFEKYPLGDIKNIEKT